jgi:hypothetical protein
MRKTIENVDGIRCTTHYMERPIKEGDLIGGPVGITRDGVHSVTEVVLYIYDDYPKWNDMLREKGGVTFKGNISNTSKTQI